MPLLPLYHRNHDVKIPVSDELLITQAGRSWHKFSGFIPEALLEGNRGGHLCFALFYFFFSWKEVVKW